jgi:hypothetical protein
VVGRHRQRQTRATSGRHDRAALREARWSRMGPRGTPDAQAGSAAWGTPRTPRAATDTRLPRPASGRPRQGGVPRAYPRGTPAPPGA